MTASQAQAANISRRSAWRAVARREFVDFWRDGRFRVCAVAVFLLLAAALGVGWQTARERTREHEVATRLTREQWLGQGHKNPHVAAHFGIYVFRPVNALSLADPGISPYVGTSSWLEAHQRDEFQARPAGERPAAFARFAPMTAAGILQCWLPLLIVLTAAPALAGERELGRLRLLLGTGVNGRTLLWGKAAGLGAALGLVLLPAALIGAALFAFAVGNRGSGYGTLDLVGRAGLLATGYAIYLVIWLLVALAVSARARTAAVAQAVGIVVWAASCLIVPRLSGAVARSLFPLPTAAVFAQSVREDIHNGVDGHNSYDERTQAFKKEVLARYGVQEEKDLPVSFEGLALEEGERYGDAVYADHYAQLERAIDRQDAVGRTVSALLTPMLAARQWSMGMAGEDTASQRRFADAAEAYRQRLIAEMNHDMTVHGKEGGYNYLADPSLWQQVKGFTYQPPRVGWAFGQHWPDALILLFWGALAAAAATAAASRMRVV